MTLVFHFNLYTYICWFMIETSLVLFWLSLVILGNFGKYLETFVWPWNKLLENLWKSLESGQKSLENCHEHCYVWTTCILKYKRKMKWLLKNKKLFSWCFTCLLHLLEKYMYFSTLKCRFCIPSWPCTYVISSTCVYIILLSGKYNILWTSAASEQKLTSFSFFFFLLQ